MAGSAGLRPVVVLGATGSIGLQTLDVAARLDLEVVALAAQRSSESFAGLAAAYPRAQLAIASDQGNDSADLRGRFGERIAFGADEVARLATLQDSIVVNGIVGVAGLAPSVAALAAGNRLALANKESLVAGGDVVLSAEKVGGGQLIPVDSEHSALWQCLVGEERVDVRRLILTASGGPFRGRAAPSLRGVSVESALNHPTWNMGPRITTDSATLMNKAFEVIEAHFLFGVDYEAIDVVVHPQSIVHSLVEFTDGTVMAELGDPDMRGPIQYAITYPDRKPVTAEPFNLVGRELTFEAPDLDAFPCLGLGYRAGVTGGSAPAVLNAADEVAVGAFLSEVLAFQEIPEVVAAALDAVPAEPLADVAAVVAADAAGRSAAANAIDRISATRTK